MFIKIRKGPGYVAGQRIRMHGSGPGLVTRSIVSGGGVAPIDPGTLADLLLWYNPGSLVQGDGTPVSTWLDSSGNGKTLSYAGGYPFGATYNAVTPSMNNQPTITTNGGGYPLFTVSSSGAPLGSADRTVYAVGKSTVPGTDDRIQMLFGWGSSNSMQKCSLYQWNDGSGQSYVGMAFGEVGGSDGGGLPIPIQTNTTQMYPVVSNTPYVFSWVYSSGTAANSNPFYINGAVGGGQPAYSSGTSSVLSTSNDTFIAATGPWNGNPYRRFWNGSMGDIIVCSGAHDSTTRQGVEQYLADKYGISI